MRCSCFLESPKNHQTKKEHIPQIVLNPCFFLGNVLAGELHKSTLRKLLEMETIPVSTHFTAPQSTKKQNSPNRPTAAAFVLTRDLPLQGVVTRRARTFGRRACESPRELGWHPGSTAGIPRGRRLSLLVA